MNIDEVKLSEYTYAKKDFPSIYTELVGVAKQLTNKWNPADSNESDPGVVLLKEAALVADHLNYNTDKNTLENYINTCVQESSLRSIAEAGGYSPDYYISATGEINFTYTFNEDDDTFSFFIPEFTYNLTNEDGDVSYVQISSLAFPESGAVTQASAMFMEGYINDLKINGEKLITGINLDENNRIYLPVSNVAQNGIFISNVKYDRDENSITEGNDWWERKVYLNTQPIGSKVYKVDYDSLKRCMYIEFPSDINNLIGEGITIKYIVSNGVNGNVAVGTINKISSPTDYSLLNIATNTESTISSENMRVSNNSPINNGKDPETMTEIFNNFKKTVGTFDTLVTCRDFSNAISTMEDSSSARVSSNAVVSDSTNEYNDSLSIVTYDDFGKYYKPANYCKIPEFRIYQFGAPIEPGDIYQDQERGILKVIIKDESGELKSIPFDYKTLSEYSESMNNNDLKMCALNPFNILDYDSNLPEYAMDRSYLPITDPRVIRNIKDALDDYKCLNTSIDTTDSGGILYFKVKTPLKINITTYDNIYYESEFKAIKDKILKTLTDKYNSSLIEFGERLNLDEIYQSILNCDDRIKNVYISQLDEDVVPVGVCAEGTSLKEVNLNEADPDGYTYYSDDSDLLLDLVSKNILAGRLCLFNFRNQLKFNYGQVIKDVYNDITDIRTNIAFTADDSRSAMKELVTTDEEAFSDDVYITIDPMSGPMENCGMNNDYEPPYWIEEDPDKTYVYKVKLTANNVDGLSFPDITIDKGTSGELLKPGDIFDLNCSTWNLPQNGIKIRYWLRRVEGVSNIEYVDIGPSTEMRVGSQSWADITPSINGNTYTYTLNLRAELVKSDTIGDTYHVIYKSNSPWAHNSFYTDPETSNRKVNTYFRTINYNEPYHIENSVTTQDETYQFVIDPDWVNQRISIKKQMPRSADNYEYEVVGWSTSQISDDIDYVVGDEYNPSKAEGIPGDLVLYAVWRKKAKGIVVPKAISENNPGQYTLNYSKTISGGTNEVLNVYYEYPTPGSTVPGHIYTNDSNSNIIVSILNYDTQHDMVLRENSTNKIIKLTNNPQWDPAGSVKEFSLNNIKIRTDTSLGVEVNGAQKIEITEDNSYITLSNPNYRDKEIFPTYCYYRFVDSAGYNIIPANTDYVLKPGQSLIIAYKQDNIYLTKSFEKGTIINSSFDIEPFIPEFVNKHKELTADQLKEIKYTTQSRPNQEVTSQERGSYSYVVYKGSGISSGDYFKLISSGNTIKTRELLETSLEKGPIKVYWIRKTKGNALFEYHINNQELTTEGKTFEEVVSGESRVTTVLNPEEYFVYKSTNESTKNISMAIFGSGTKISIPKAYALSTDPSFWNKPDENLVWDKETGESAIYRLIKKQGTDAKLNDTKIDLGGNTKFYITEMSTVTLGKGSILYIINSGAEEPIKLTTDYTKIEGDITYSTLDEAGNRSPDYSLIQGPQGYYLANASLDIASRDNSFPIKSIIPDGRISSTTEEQEIIITYDRGNNEKTLTNTSFQPEVNIEYLNGSGVSLNSGKIGMTYDVVPTYLNYETTVSGLPMDNTVCLSELDTEKIPFKTKGNKGSVSMSFGYYSKFSELINSDNSSAFEPTREGIATDTDTDEHDTNELVNSDSGELNLLYNYIIPIHFSQEENMTFSRVRNKIKAELKFHEGDSADKTIVLYEYGRSIPESETSELTFNTDDAIYLLTFNINYLNKDQFIEAENNYVIENLDLVISWDFTDEEISEVPIEVMPIKVYNGANSGFDSGRLSLENLVDHMNYLVENSTAKGTKIYYINEPDNSIAIQDKNIFMKLPSSTSVSKSNSTNINPDFLYDKNNIANRLVLPIIDIKTMYKNSNYINLTKSVKKYTEKISDIEEED